MSKNTIREYKAFWDKSKQVLIYKDTKLYIDQIPTLLKLEYYNCRRLLYNNLMFSIKDI